MSNLKKEIQKPLNVLEIFDIAKKSCNLIPYSDMFSFVTIDELFSENPIYSVESKYERDPNSCIILYLTSKHFGHWCILNRLVRDDKTIYNFLDSYGELLDDQLNHINEEFREVSNQDGNYLTKLLYDCVKDNNSDVHYNDLELQMLNDKIATCGRYVALFLKYNDMTVEEFANTLADASDYYDIPIDMLVTLLTLDD